MRRKYEITEAGNLVEVLRRQAKAATFQSPTSLFSDPALVCHRRGTHSESPAAGFVFHAMYMFASGRFMSPKTEVSEGGRSATANYEEGEWSQHHIPSMVIAPLFRQVRSAGGGEAALLRLVPTTQRSHGHSSCRPPGPRVLGQQCGASPWQGSAG